MATMRQNDDLDIEYLQVLRRMKPYITCIMNNYYIELIRVWLEKLSDVNLEDKKLRNAYLIELGKQIEAGVFEEPFINPPPEGILPPFQKTWQGQPPEKDKKNEQMWPNTNATSEDTTSQPSMHNYTHFGLSQNTHFPIAGIGCNVQGKDGAEIKQINSSRLPAAPSGNMTRKKQHKSKFSQPSVDVNEKLKLVENFSKNVFNNLRLVKKKKQQKMKKQQNVYTVTRQDFKANEYGKAYAGQNFYEPDEIPTYQNVKKRKHIIPKRKPGHQRQLTSEDSSWFDLTEISTPTGFASGDTEMAPMTYEANGAIEMQDMYETKIANLLNVIDGLKNENLTLNQNMDQYEKNLSLRNILEQKCFKNNRVISGNTKAETSLHNLAGEVECLKSRLQELVDIKLGLQNSHFAVTTEWQNTITTLHRRLNLLQRRNNELKVENNELERKLNEVEMERKKDLMCQKKKLTELHAKEADMLKQIHARATTDLESKYNLKMAEQEEEYLKKLDELKENEEDQFSSFKNDYENKINGIKRDYEIQMNYLKEEFEKILNIKDTELEKLENLLQEQCIRMQEEVQLIRCQVENNAHSTSESYIDKIAFLQKCILKMERLFRKSEKENFKQLFKLKRELEFKEKTNQLALTTQKADLISNTVSGKQFEIDIIITQLEEHYKKLLSDQQKRHTEEKKYDSKVITELKDELSKYRTEF